MPSYIHCDTLDEMMRLGWPSVIVVVQGSHSTVAIDEHAHLILAGERSSVRDVVAVVSSFFRTTAYRAHLVSPYPTPIRCTQRSDWLVVHVQHLPYTAEEAPKGLWLDSLARAIQQSLSLRIWFQIDELKNSNSNLYYTTAKWLLGVPVHHCHSSRSRHCSWECKRIQ